MSKINQIIEQRHRTHGDFAEQARISQCLKRIIWGEPHAWQSMTYEQREAIEMILLKVGRIVAGNPNVKEHWDDIAGYAILTSERITEDNSGFRVYGGVGETITRQA